MRHLAFSIVMLLPFLISFKTSAPSEGQPDQIDWSRGPDVPLPRGGYYGAWYRGGFLLGGGTYWKDEKKVWTDKVSFFDPIENKWTEREPLPRPLAYGVTAQFGNKLLIMGGIDQEENLNRTMYSYDGRKWVKAGESPIGFVYATGAIVRRRVYVLGGATSASDVTKATNQMWSFEVDKKRWEELSPIPGPPREIHATAAVGESIFVFGGVTQEPGKPFRNLGDAHRFDTRSKTWKAISSLPQPARAFWATAVGNFIYLLGGFGEGGLNTVYRYDPVRNTYELFSQMPLPVMDTKFFFHDGTFYGAGGEDKPRSRFSGLLIGRLRTT